VNLVDAKKKKTYLIVPGGISLKPGERVRLRAARTKIVKNLGACSADSAVRADFRFALKVQAP
jgi:hypothetical protein